MILSHFPVSSFRSTGALRRRAEAGGGGARGAGAGVQEVRPEHAVGSVPGVPGAQRGPAQTGGPGPREEVTSPLFALV